MRSLILIAFLLWSAPALAVLSGTGRAISGDTLVIAGTLVRLAAVDAPEFDQTCTRGGQSWACGEAATANLAAAVEGRDIICRDEVTVGSETVTAVCTVDGRDLAVAILGAGYAVNRAPNLDSHTAAEAEAKAAGRGLWGGEFMDPERWRKMTDCGCTARHNAYMKNAKAATTTE